MEAAKYERQPQVRRMQDAYMALSSRAMVIEKLSKKLGADDPIVSAEDERVARTRIFAALSTTGEPARAVQCMSAEPSASYSWAVCLCVLLWRGQPSQPCRIWDTAVSHLERIQPTKTTSRGEHLSRRCA